MKRKILNLIVILCCMITLFTSCTAQPTALISEVDLNHADSKVQDFVNRCSSQNGIYLYSDGKENNYFFLNGNNVTEGDLAPVFTDIRGEIQGDTLAIYYSENYTDDSKIKEISSRLLYKINSDKNFAFIKVYKNGQETPFDMIGN